MRLRIRCLFSSLVYTYYWMVRAWFCSSPYAWHKRRQMLFLPRKTSCIYHSSLSASVFSQEEEVMCSPVNHNILLLLCGILFWEHVLVYPTGGFVFIHAFVPFQHL